MSHDVLSTGPSKEADSLGFEGSGLSPIGIPVLRGPSRSVGCGRSCGQPVTTPAILTSVNLVVKESIHQLDVGPRRIRRGCSPGRRQSIWATCPSGRPLFQMRFGSSSSAATATEIETMIRGDLMPGELVAQQMRLACCFGRPPLAAGS